MRKVMLALLLIASALIGVPGNAADAGYTTVNSMVPVGDGTIHLDTTVYIPTATVTAPGWPLIVRQHGGGSNKDNEYDVKYALNAIPRGFAVLMYSVRGHGNSEGSFDFFGPETVSDTSNVLDWVDVNIPTIDTNNVGMSGHSQGGGTSLLPAALDPRERIKAVAVGNTFDSLSHALNPNDCFKFSFATGIFAAAYKATQSRTNDDLAVRWGATWYTDTEDYQIPPQGPLSIPYLFDSTTNEVASRSPLTYVNALIDRRIPVFWSNSWEDQLFPGDHPEMILQPLQDSGVPVHYWFASGGHAAGPNDPTDEANKESAMLDWFDEFLRGVSHGMSTGPKVDYAQRVPGTTGDWIHKTAPAWPVAAQATSLYARSNGELSLQQGSQDVGVIANGLVNANVANDAIVSQEIPGRIPFGDLGSTVKSLPERGTPADTAIFESELLTTDIEVTGAPFLDVSVSFSSMQIDDAAGVANPFQLNGKIWDVAPDGSARMLNRGCWSGRDNTRFALWPNSYIIKAGHRIRLDISHVDFPTFEADKEPVVTVLGPGTNIQLPVVSGSI